MNCCYVRLTVDAGALAEKVDVICIVSGDGDYVELGWYLKTHGVRVEAMAFERCTARDLKEAVDKFYPITNDMFLDFNSSNLN